MAYPPENNPYVPGDPYSYDLKWMVDQIRSWKDPMESAAEAKASEEAAAASEANAAASAASALASKQSAAASEAAAESYAASIADPVSGLVASWLAAHITQPTTPAIDSSLTVSEAAADAKAAGDRIINNKKYVEAVNGIEPISIDLTSDQIYMTGHFMSGVHIITAAGMHNLIKIENKNIATITLPPINTTLGGTPTVVAFKNGTNCGQLIGSQTASTSFTLPEDYDELWLNWWNSGTATPAFTSFSYTPRFALYDNRIIYNLVKKPFDFAGKRIYFCGDSITYGYTSGTSNVHGTGDFPTLFCNKFGAIKYDLSQAGASLSRVSGYPCIQDQVSSIPANGADMIFVQGGSNDWQLGKTCADVYIATDAICSTINNSNPNADVFFVLPINNAYKTPVVTPVTTINFIRDKMAEAAMMHDANAKFNIINGQFFNFPTLKEDPYLIAWAYGDGLHPTAAAYKTLYYNGMVNALI